MLGIDALSVGPWTTKMVALALAAGPDFKPAQYDLSGLPPYKPEQMALGVVRVYGTPLEALVGRWANDFRSRQGPVRLEAYLVNTTQGLAGPVTGKADIGLMGTAPGTPAWWRSRESSDSSRWRSALRAAHMMI